MNPINYIDFVINVVDETEDYLRSRAVTDEIKYKIRENKDRMLKVTCGVYSLDRKRIVTRYWLKSEWEDIKEKGYYMV